MQRVIQSTHSRVGVQDALALILNGDVSDMSEAPTDEDLIEMYNPVSEADEEVDEEEDEKEEEKEEVEQNEMV